MLQVMQDLGPKQRKYLISGDENWIFWDSYHHRMWAEDREEVLPNVKRMICSKRQCYRNISCALALFPLNFFLRDKTIIHIFFTEIILPSIVENLSVTGPKLKATATRLHIDNAKPHNSRLSLQKIEEYGFIRMPQPPYSPDLAPCDFFLFGYLKSQLEGKAFFDVSLFGEGNDLSFSRWSCERLATFLCTWINPGKSSCPREFIHQKWRTKHAFPCYELPAPSSRMNQTE
jgi:hypothetical protein